MALTVPLRSPPTICFLAAMGGIYQAKLLFPDAIFRLSYVLHATWFLAVVAAELAVLASALALLLLMAVHLSAVIAASWVLQQWLVQHGRVADRACARSTTIRANFLAVLAPDAVSAPQSIP